MPWQGPERRKVEAGSRAIQRALQAQQQARSGKAPAAAEDSDRAKRPRLDAAAGAGAAAEAARDQLLRNLMSGAAFRQPQAAGAVR